MWLMMCNLNVNLGVPQGSVLGLLRFIIRDINLFLYIVDSVCMQMTSLYMQTELSM